MPLESATFINQLNSSNPDGSDSVVQGDDHIRLIKASLQSTFTGITGPVTVTQTDLNSIPTLASTQAAHTTDLANKLDTTTGGTVVGDVAVTGNLSATGTLTITGAAAAASLSATTITAQTIQQNGMALMPVGAIMYWPNSTAPAGWRICDGTNGTPDLRDRFVVGAGLTYSVGAIGGTASQTLTTNAAGNHSHGGAVATAGAHSHGGATAPTVLTPDELPPAFSLSNAAGVGLANGSGPFFVATSGVGNPHQHGIYADGNHQHTITADGTHSHTATFDNRPPYIALYLIMYLGS